MPPTKPTVAALLLFDPAVNFEAPSFRDRWPAGGHGFFNASPSEEDLEAALWYADELLGRMGLAPLANETAAR
jgi:hypothetical protein